MVIADPPVEPAVNVTVAVPIPPAIAEMVGAPGEVNGVTDDEADELLVPATFTARTRTLYEVPFVRPEITKGDAVTPEDCHDVPLSVENSMFCTAAPPLLDTENATDADASPGVMLEIVGADGTVRGTPRPIADAAPLPATFTARRATSYDVPFVRKKMTIGDVLPDAVCHDEPPFVEYWYDVIEEPPFAPAVNATESDPLPGVMTPRVGAEGTVRGVVVDADVANVPVPAAFTAATWTRYAVPLVRPEITSVVDSDAPSLNVVHEVPLFDDHWMM